MTCATANKKCLLLLVFLFGALALGIGFYIWHAEKNRMTSSVSSTSLIDAPLMPEFHLKDGHGKAFSQANLKGHFSLLFFGYTHCQGICPLTMTLLAQLYTALKIEKLPLPQVIFITLDPKRDTAPIVAQYATAFNPAFVGLTGPLSRIKQLSKQMGVVYIQAQQNKSNQDNYQIDHSGSLYLINPEGKLVALFSPPLDKASIKKDYTALVRQ
ncbi:MAG: hypothetical protein RLZZ225_543 [Pseudomonadota bacterium]|jgi:protein SCO1/2